MNIHQVIIKNDGFEIIDADTSFYAFLGLREYWAFDKLIIENYREQFDIFYEQFLKEREDNQGIDPVPTKFFLRLIDESGGNHPYICWFSSGATKDRTKINLIEVNDLIEEASMFEKNMEIKDTILALYNDAYFEYDPVMDTFSTYYIDKGPKSIATVGIEAFEALISKDADAGLKEEVGEFITGLRIGNREQAIVIPKDINDHSRENMTTFIHSAAVYDNGIYERSCGYIHIGHNGSVNVNKRMEVDSLTGVITKAEITGRAISLIDVHKTQNITISIIDIDYFKRVNDTFGHMKGDEVLKTVASIIEAAVGKDGTVGRIGGDEFMVIFYDAYDMENMRENLKSIKNHVSAAYPPDIPDQPAVTLSIGCAAYPKDADNFSDLFMLADYALYRAKEKGRDRYIIYDIAKHGGLEVAKNVARSDRIEGRGDLSLGDIMCSMLDMVASGKEYPLQKLLDDFVVNFEVHRVMIYSGDRLQLKNYAGEAIPDEILIRDTEIYTQLKDYPLIFNEAGEVCINEVRALEDKHKQIYDCMKAQNIASFIQFRITDKDGVPSVVSLEAVSKKIMWNKEHMKYFRLFAHLLQNYELS